MNIEQIQERAYGHALTQGWFAEEPSFGSSMCLLQQEISEAVEAYRTDEFRPWKTRRAETGMELRVALDEFGKPEGVAAELADVIFRVAELLGHYGHSLAAVVPIEPIIFRAWAAHLQGPGDWFALLHLYAGQAIQNYWRCRYSPFWINQLGYLVETVLGMDQEYHLGLEAAIEEKLAYNQVRPYRGLHRFL